MAIVTVIEKLNYLNFHKEIIDLRLKYDTGWVVFFTILFIVISYLELVCDLSRTIDENWLYVCIPDFMYYFKAFDFL